MIIHRIEQQTPEWFELRKLKFTGSEAQAIGNGGKGLETLVEKLVRNAITPDEPYTNENMERGNELEDAARMSYIFETGIEITQVGFIELDNYTGYSPDGIMEPYPDSIEFFIEIKCMANKAYFTFLKDGKIDTKYQWQMQHGFLCTEAKYCDFIAYNPNFKTYIIIQRVYPDAEKIEKLKAGIEKGKNLLDELLANEAIKKELE